MIYLLEDDNNIRKIVVYTLNSQGLECTDFSTPRDFWKAFNRRKPDLTLLDIMLPDEDGLSILKKIKSNKDTSSIPVIILTAKDTEFDMVTGLNDGADDYITKPFGMMALVARVKAVLRRYENTNPHNIKHDDNNSSQNNNKSSEFSVSGTKKLTLGCIVLDPVKHTVFVDKKQIFLTIKEFDLLALLIKNKNKVLTRENLLNAIWNVDADVESRTIDVHIRTLRQKLGDYGFYIETIRGLGYKIGKINQPKGDKN